jgi:multiple sugar transport system permease protein
MVFPALLLIALWSYYPLFRGMIMAFQEYKITGESPFVGLDNFILLFMDSSFWMSIVRTFYFVALTMLLSFTTPIILAIMLTDVPRFKIFFRTLSFLPQMSSGLVIALLWKLMYEPTPEGFFNQIITIFNYIPFVDIAPQQWLHDPALAMICVIMPTVWATLGMQSLIYLAALASLPTDVYEAAEIDGASIWTKITSITLPSIMPLIIINFVGAFIGTFQNMGNIFLMTFGGPGESTTVVGLKIWVEAYANLRFSMATTMAWVMGAMLIGFSYFQIKFLGKIEYKRAK